jgi:hypothetical protein
MPQGSTTSQSSTSSTAVQAPNSVNPGITSLFNSIFGGSGGLGSTASTTTQNVQSGQQLTNNISSLYSSLQTNSQGAYQQGLASIKAAAGAGGNALGTSTTAQIGNYAGNYIQNLNNTATSMGLSELGTQSASAGGTLSLLSSAANQYYSPGSTTTGSGTSNTTQTGIGAWADPILGLAGAGLGAAGAAGSFGALFA